MWKLALRSVSSALFDKSLIGIPKVEKVPGSGGEEDEINIRMEVVVDPDGPNPMTTYVEAQVYILKAFFSGNAGTVFVQVAEDDMVAEAEAETKAKGEAGLQLLLPQIELLQSHPCNYFSLPRTAT